MFRGTHLVDKLLVLVDRDLFCEGSALIGFMPYGDARVTLDVHKRGHFIPKGWFAKQLDDLLKPAN